MKHQKGEKRGGPIPLHKPQEDKKVHIPHVMGPDDPIPDFNKNGLVPVERKDFRDALKGQVKRCKRAQQAIVSTMERTADVLEELQRQADSQLEETLKFHGKMGI
jgi:hypothetical protein